jgi:hypothetical protein
MVGVSLIFTMGGMGWYFVVPILSWISQLSQYHLKLYNADPGNSAPIDHLSDMMGQLVYTGALVSAVFTLGMVYFRLINPLVTVIFLLFVTWGPLIGIFVSNQFALSQIINRAKWQTLSQLQASIEKLQAREAIPSEETLAHLDKLMDYHDRIRSTRNTALDLRASLSFLNSLLLPLIAFLIANLDLLLAYFLP